MMFSRAALREAVDHALKSNLAEWEAAAVRERREEAEHLEKWLKDSGPEWVRFADRVKAKIKNGFPIENKDLPNGGDPFRSSVSTFKKKGRSFRTEYRAPSELLNLAAVLDAATDDKISTSGLASLGIGQRTMSSVVRHLRPGSQG